MLLAALEQRRFDIVFHQYRRQAVGFTRQKAQMEHVEVQHVEAPCAAQAAQQLHHLAALVLDGEDG